MKQIKYHADKPLPTKTVFQQFAESSDNSIFIFTVMEKPVLDEYIVTFFFIYLLGKPPRI